MARAAGLSWRAVLPAPIVLAAALALLAMPAGASVAGCPDARAMPGSVSRAKLQKAVVCLVNRARASHHGANLQRNPDLDSLGQAHAGLMVKEHCFTHKCPGEDPLKKRFRKSDYVHGSSSFRYAEELGYESTPRQMVVRWLKDPSERANLLDDHLEDIGVGAKRGAPKRGVHGRRFVTYTVELGALQGPERHGR